MSRVLDIISHSEDQTEALGQKLVSVFAPGDVVVLTGPLGAGKTAFVRGLATGLNLDKTRVNSPSYTIVNEYPGEHTLYHFDLFRMVDTSELEEIGWDDYLARKALVVIEWGEKAEKMLPERYFSIVFEMLGETDRGIQVFLIES